MHRTASGHIKVIESYPTVHKVGDKVFVHSIITDVTEKTRAQDGQKALRILSEKLIQARINMEEMSTIVLDFAVLLTSAEDGYVGCVDEDTRNIRIYATSKMHEKSFEDACSGELKLNTDGSYKGLCGASLKGLIPLINNESEEIDCLQRNGRKKIIISNHLSFPVMLENELVGQIVVMNSRVGFAEHDIDLLSEIANLYALAIKGVKEREKDILLDELINNMADGVAVYLRSADGDFIFKSLNRAGLSVSGLDISEVRGKRVAQVYPGINESPLLKVFREVWDTGEPQHCPITHYVDSQQILYVENYVF